MEVIAQLKQGNHFFGPPCMAIGILWDNFRTPYRLHGQVIALARNKQSASDCSAAGDLFIAQRTLPICSTSWPQEPTTSVTQNLIDIVNCLSRNAEKIAH